MDAIDDQNRRAQIEQLAERKLKNLSAYINGVLGEEPGAISQQLLRRLHHLVGFNIKGKLGPDATGAKELTLRISSVFNRLLLEIIQAHYSTKQREHDFKKLVDSKGCTISNPTLTDAVMSQLVKLYKATDHFTDTSFERDVLIEFLLKKLANQNCTKRQISRILQTLYKCSCFLITHMDGAPGRLKLRSELVNEDDLRYQHDVELIKLAQEHSIRLTPESWAFLLRGNSYPKNISNIQSILDKFLSPPSVQELEQAIEISGDKFGLASVICNLRDFECLIRDSLSRPILCDQLDSIYEIVERLPQLTNLYTIRQNRSLCFELNGSTSCCEPE